MQTDIRHIMICPFLIVEFFTITCLVKILVKLHLFHYCDCKNTAFSFDWENHTTSVLHRDLES